MSELAKALAAFQAEMPVVAKGKTAKVPTKAGGSYTYTYAGLADVSEVAMPLLARNGLSFSACPRLAERGYELVGRLLHSGGEVVEGALPIAGNTPQEMGSSLTYMRRYLLGCMTGLVTDDDDDGQLAQSGAKKAAAKRAAPPAQDRPAPADGNTASPAQVRMMGALMGQLGMTDRSLALAFVTDVIGHPVESRNELTKAEATKVIDALKKDLGDDDGPTP